MKRKTRRGLTIGIVFCVLLAIAALVLAVNNYDHVRQSAGYDPDYGGEERWNNVPAIPLSALTLAIGDVQTEGEVLVEHIGTLPLDAVVIGVIVDVNTAYSQTSSMTVGTAADFDAYLAAGEVTEQTAGDYAEYAHSGAVATDETAVYVFVDGTGSSLGSAAGEAQVTVLYAIPGVRSSSWANAQTRTDGTEYSTQTTFETAFPSLDWSDFVGN